MIATLLKHFLERHQIKYVSMLHSPAYTAEEVARAAHIPSQELAKSVMVKLDGKLAMAVVPASCRVDLEALKRLVGASAADVATEHDFGEVFRGCELGAMPPFGNLWNVPVYVSRSLAADEHIAFNAGTHTEVISLAFKDYLRLVEPRVLDFAKPL
jgi:Ala-tRNA(Pro) deacylase